VRGARGGGIALKGQMGMGRRRMRVWREWGEGEERGEVWGWVGTSCRCGIAVIEGGGVGGVAEERKGGKRECQDEDMGRWGG